jgi:multidrug efflux system membrane fusion protein
VNLKHGVSLGMIAVVVVWMAWPRERGTVVDDYAITDADAQITAIAADSAANSNDQAFTVRVARIDVENYVERVRVRGQTKAFRHVEIRAEVAGRVVATPVARGARVSAGDVLCEIAVDSRATDLQEARSRQEEAQMEYDGAVDLQSRGLQSRVSVAQRKAALDSATAALTRAELAYTKTRITAPFDGIMETRTVEVGDLMNIGGTCASLLDDTPMLLTGVVPEHEVGKLFIGAPVTASLLTGETVEGQVTYISRAADTSARSYTIEVEITAAENTIRQGITAEIYIAAQETMAHLIPASAMTLNDAGAIGVKTVDQNSTVQFAEVTVIGENAGADSGLWVTGLPSSAVVITHGQEVVFPGQTVQADFSWSSLTDSSL